MTDLSHFSVETVAQMDRCPVDPATFLAVRPQASIKTVAALNRRLRNGKPYPGAYKIPGDRQWSIDLVEHDRQIASLLKSSAVEQAVEAVKQEIGEDLLEFISEDSVMRKVQQRLAAA